MAQNFFLIRAKDDAASHANRSGRHHQERDEEASTSRSPRKPRPMAAMRVLDAPAHRQRHQGFLDMQAILGFLIDH